MKNVSTPSDSFTASAEAWKLPRALMGGTRAMRAMGETYLPREPAESETAYRVRLARSTLFNGFRKTVENMTGKVFSRGIVLGDDVPEPLKAMAENIDLAGRHLDVFARDAFKDAMQPGVGFLMVEMERAPVGPDGQPVEITQADEKASGRRPYLCFIPAEDVIGWLSERIAGVETLTQVRIAETVDEPDGEFATRKVAQIRVLYRGRWETWRKAEKGDAWVLHESGTSSIPEITLAPVYINRTGFMTGAPPLQDLADLNVAHWQSSSDQRNILHVARVPILFGAGFAEGEAIVVGASSMTRTSDPAAKLAYVEHSGAAIASGRDDLKDLELQMQVMGLELLIPKPGGGTATGDAIDESKANSTLAFMARALQDALEQCFAWMAEYAGLGKDGGSLTVNTDYGVSMRDAADLQTLQVDVREGRISLETYLSELKRRGVLADAVDVEDEIDRADNQPPSFAAGAPGLPQDTPQDPPAA